MQSPQDPEASVTVKEAASRIGYSIRQTDRFIQNGILKATHVNKSLRTVTVASIEAFHRTHGNRPVDPLDPLREQLYTHEQLTSDLLHQQALLRQQISAQDAALRQRYSDLEAQLRLLKTQLQQERDARHTLEQMVAAISLTGPTGHQEDAWHLFHTLLGYIPRAPHQGSSPQEKRGYSQETIRLAHFAEQHGIEPSTLRQHAEKTPGLATVYERRNAAVKKREWWVTPEQKYPLLHSWQAQNKPMTPCPDCPHTLEEQHAECPVEEPTVVKTMPEEGERERVHHLSGERIPGMVFTLHAGNSLTGEQALTPLQKGDEH